MISKLTWDSCVCSLLWTMQQAPRARTLAGDHGHPPVRARRASCIVQKRKVAILDGDPSDFLAKTDWISKLTGVLVYVLYSGQCSKPHVHEREWMTMATRLCARVEHLVLFRIDKSPCWFGNPSETLAVTDWFAKCTWVLVHVLYCGQYRKTRVRER